MISSIIIIGTIFWAHEQYIGRKAWQATYKKSRFNGVIKDTVHILGQGDLPTYIFTNDSSHFSDLNEGYMQGRAKVVDSLSKVSGADTVYIFRKNDSEKYVQIYPPY